EKSVIQTKINNLNKEFEKNLCFFSFVIDFYLRLLIKQLFSLFAQYIFYFLKQFMVNCCPALNKSENI
ncbi:MAG TPA: hypothetical protein PLJ38_11725, partial [bacterium]|nr:hypothetical protein [bacterium]